MQIKWNDGWLFYSEKNIEKKAVILPHDAMICGSREPLSPGKDAVGYFTGDVYHYEKSFSLKREAGNESVSLIFDGVYQNSTVILNGKSLVFHPYGYTAFEVELSEALKYDEENLLEVIVDNSELPNSRWYSGGGIYRDVYLRTSNKRHIPWQGIRVDTVSISPAKIRVRTELTGGVLSNEEVRIEIYLQDRIVATGSGTDEEIEINEPKLWSDTSPSLYECRVNILSEGILIDYDSVNFGIRMMEWSTEGLFVNGKNTLLRGACVHHDNGVLGACSYLESEERKVKILKEHGYNALRMAHNPASEELLKACDKYGMYVMDETFDMWFQHKNKYDYARYFNDYYLEDTAAMVKHDYNHPSVIMYSIGNEVGEPANEDGLSVASKMIKLIHEMDQSRPVTAGINFMVLLLSSKGKGLFDENGLAGKSFAEAPKESKEDDNIKSGSLIFNTLMTVMGKGINRIGNSRKADAVTSPILDLLDIAGYNYASGRYVKEGSLHPERIVVGSETYPQDIYDNWEKVKKYPYLIGDFMWTGWDYLGEAAIGSWNYEGVSMTNIKYPWLLSCAGAIDILGYPGAEAAYASTVWNKTEIPFIGVRPINHPGIRVTRSAWRGTNAMASWSWKGCDGNKAVVEVYADAHKAELILNGRSIGTKKLKKMKALFRVPYAAGTLEAKTYDAEGKLLGTSALSSATGEPIIAIVPEINVTKPEGIVYVNIEIQGANAIRECNADRKISISVDNATLLGFGSAKPNPIYPYNGHECETYYGQSQAIVRAGEAGKITIRVEDEYGHESIKVIEIH